MTVLALIASALLGGCGSDHREPANGPLTVPVTRPVSTPAPGRPPGKVVTQASGAVVQLPPRPTVTHVDPSPGCTKDLRRIKDKAFYVIRPPSPGISARREGDQVVVSYRFTRLPSRCPAAELHLAFDVSSDSVPGQSRTLPIRSLGGEYRTTLLSRVRTADVVLATAYSAQGSPSHTVRVLIT